MTCDVSFLLRLLLLLSFLLTLDQSLLLRAANHTATVYDIFWALGFALRARDCRYLWKAQMLFWTLGGYVTGVVIGANACVHHA